MKVIKNKIHETYYDFYEGKKSDHVFIFIHGAVSTNQFWDTIYKDFLPHGDVILLNLIGHAPSTANWETLKNFEGLLTNQNEAIEKIVKKHYKDENKKIILIGHSTGGTISLLSSIFYPNKYYAVIALTPIVTNELGIYSPLNIPINFLSKIRIQKDSIWKAQFDILQYAIKNHSDLAYTFLPFFGAHESFFNEKEKAYVEEFCDKILDQHYSTLQHYSLFFNDVINNPKNSYYGRYRDFLDSKLKLTSFSLVFGGKNDLLVQVEQHRQAATITNSKYIEIDNCGHFCTVDNPIKIIKDTKEFLNLI